MGQAVEDLQPADGMFHGNAGFRVSPVVFFLRGGQLGIGVILGFPRPFVRQVYFGLLAIIFLRPLEAEVEPPWPGDIARIEEEIGILRGIIQEKKG